jgi:ATP-binding cassette subfamily B protein
MTAHAPAPTGARIAGASRLGVLATVRRGVQVSPEMVRGFRLTALLAVVAAAGKVVVPITVQQTVDTGILAPGGPDVHRVALLVCGAIAVLALTSASSVLVNVRLFRATEAGLASLRERAFRHVHDLSVLTQGSERRGSLVSRVTSDVDTVSVFVQWGGIQLLVAVLQIAVATVLMALYSWQLTLVVWLCFGPLMLALRPAQRRVSGAYTDVRERVGAMLGAVSEAVVGAETVRAYAVEDRVQRRVDAAVRATRDAMVRAQRLVSLVFAGGVLASNVVLCAVVVVGTWLGIAGDLSVGRLLAFLFLVQLFTGPVQVATEILNELQNAVAGWRRVLAVLETPVDVADPGPDGVVTPRGPATVELHDVHFAYPDGEPVLHGVDLTIPPRTSVAVVGATGSGKSTLAKLVVRLMDPTHGRVLIDGVDVRRIRVQNLRRRVMLVPQEGFLFDGTLADNMAYGLAVRDASERDARLRAAMCELGLSGWLDELPHGLATTVGQRGEALSAGERQLVAIVRAHLAAADLLVLDEATSAVDPATEVRIARALEQLTEGRSTVTIAHRLSTAEAADLVVVMDAGRVVQVGEHGRLVGEPGPYAAMHGAWVAQTR